MAWIRPLHGEIVLPTRDRIMLRRILVLLLVLMAMATSSQASLRNIQMEAHDIEGGSEGDPDGGDYSPSPKPDINIVYPVNVFIIRGVVINSCVMYLPNTHCAYDDKYSPLLVQVMQRTSMRVVK
jgi:hypothetical protein